MIKFNLDGASGGKPGPAGVSGVLANNRGCSKVADNNP